MSSAPATQERPERSRNAKAQARHRAKRKAYIEQLEQTVTKLQTALGFTPEQVSALPPPLAKIRELEQENARILKENDELRRLLAESGSRVMPLDVSRRPSTTAFHDSRNCDRDYKRRKVGDDGMYMNESNGSSDMLSRAPPPLTIPQPTSQPHYSSLSSNHSASSTPGMFSLHGPPFQMPNTPSGSSSTSSPPFSASPAQMQTPSSAVSPVVNTRPGLSGHSSLSYSGSNYHVKVEDENTYTPNHTNSHQPPNHYSLPSFTHTAQQDHSGLDNWHTYSSERVPIHR
ncbi:hypothetical protein K435DRAFT_857549 [Dendrothele bispora CBS 962.96]|uniref:BZIP domain-containing protein n=1 Tax=Dendrothele bispora (strain CBS 962.96) TaxID=1314807 RepID=A0A4S8M5K3_DENBC|nr:hypothetical protein K435DRAFT_857549 [Dendrothele bispora CBS 962.96]